MIKDIEAKMPGYIKPDYQIKEEPLQVWTPFDEEANFRPNLYTRLLVPYEDSHSTLIKDPMVDIKDARVL